MGVPANSLDVTQAGLVKFDGVSSFTGVTVTNHDVLVGSTSNGITSVGPGTAGQVLQSGGAAADPAYSTATFPTTAGSNGNVLTSNGTNFVSSLPFGYSLYMGGISQSGTPFLASKTYIFYSNNCTSVPTPFQISPTTLSGSYLVVPATGTITAVYGFIGIGTGGSADPATINVVANGGAPSLITNNVVLTATGNVAFSGTGLNIAVTAGDILQLQFVTPAWASGPVYTGYSLSIYIQ